MLPSHVDLVVQEVQDAVVSEVVEDVDVEAEKEEDMVVDVVEVMEDVEVHVAEEDLVEAHVEDLLEAAVEEREVVVEARAMEVNSRPTEEPALKKFNFKSVSVMMSLFQIMTRLVLMMYV